MFGGGGLDDIEDMGIEGFVGISKVLETIRSSLKPETAHLAYFKLKLCS